MFISPGFLGANPAQFISHQSILIRSIWNTSRQATSTGQLEHSLNFHVIPSRLLGNMRGVQRTPGCTSACTVLSCPRRTRMSSGQSTPLLLHATMQASKCATVKWKIAPPTMCSIVDLIDMDGQRRIWTWQGWAGVVPGSGGRQNKIIN